MGEGCTPQACRWVLRRLPLLSGGELIGSDRRKVERHLLACPPCRQRRAALEATHGLLQGIGGETLEAPASAPSLWPALERQIREERRGLRVRLHDRLDAWLDEVSAWFRFGFGLPVSRPRPAAALALAVALLAAVVAGIGVRWSAEGRDAGLVAGPPLSLPLAERVPRGESADLIPAPPASADPSPAPVVPPTAISSVQGDLDHGTPMGPNAPMPEPIAY